MGMKIATISGVGCLRSVYSPRSNRFTHGSFPAPVPSVVEDLAPLQDATHPHMTPDLRKSGRSVIPLVEGECEDVQVVRLEGDRFIVTAQQAIDCLSLASQAARFQSQFNELLQKLYVWVDERRTRVSAAYISISREGITLLVVQRDVAADFELEEQLVDLDLEVANEGEFDIIPFNTLLVPRVGSDVLKSFLSSGQIISHQVNAERI